jgi:hypothetical protein
MIPLSELATIIARYPGGQAEIKNQLEGYLYRGEIETINIADGQLQIKFKWLAQAQGFPPSPEQWINNDNLFFTWSPKPFNEINDIGPDASGGGHKLYISSFISGIVVTIFPPDGSKLDPAEVKGLLPATKKKILIVGNEKKQS